MNCLDLTCMANINSMGAPRYNAFRRHHFVKQIGKSSSGASDGTASGCRTWQELLSNPASVVKYLGIHNELWLIQHSQEPRLKL